MDNQYYAEERRSLLRQRGIARYMLLGTVIATAVDILLLFAQADVFIPYCAAAPYYAVYLGYYFDRYALSTYTATAMVMAFVCLGVYLLLWWRAKKHDRALRWGMILLIVDTVVLLLFAILMLDNPGSCVFEVILHVAVIYEISVGLKSGKRLKQLERKEKSFATNQFEEYETPAESEYSDML